MVVYPAPGIKPPGRWSLRGLAAAPLPDRDKSGIYCEILSLLSAVPIVLNVVTIWLELVSM